MRSENTPPDAPENIVENTSVDTLFTDVLGPEYWVSNAGVSRRSWEILLLRKAMLDDHLWSLAECADRYGISRERVRQLEQEAVAKLLAWKQEEDRRKEEARKEIHAKFHLQRAPLHHFAESVRLEECSFSCSENLLAAPRRRPHRTFAELRNQVLELLA